jgi:hypothetical protein
LNDWKTEMQDKGYWKPHPTDPGSQPDDVIKQSRDPTTPWRAKVSQKVGTMLSKPKTLHAWDHEANEDARVFHEYVSGADGLNWDFKRQWEARKREHDEERRNPAAGI